MGKLVILKIGEGNFDQGFSVMLQISDEMEDGGLDLSVRLTAEMPGRLPPMPELPLDYHRWQASYRQLGMRSRLNAPAGQVTNVAVTGDCLEAAQILRDRLNEWLRAESFRPIREKWLEKLMPTEVVRVIIQTEHDLVQRLPWTVWDVLERYPKAEIALSAPAYERVHRRLTPRTKIRILGILGNSDGIDTQADRAYLEQLPDAEVCFLVEPPRKQLNDHLWDQHWDILFFAGHSTSQGKDGQGELAINAHERLSISQLRYALRKALQRGLQLAIFNSCDGLGLARELADLQIPQVMVMREPVPDAVAQEFLKYFLATFAQGEPLYLAVRAARERLQALEDQYLCATWLPVIYQNPAEVPPTWQRLLGRSALATLAQETGSALPGQALYQAPAPPKPSLLQRMSSGVKHGARAIATGLVATALLSGIRYGGLLQPLELAAYDQMMRLRPTEPLDDRLLVVTINESERQRYGAPIDTARYTSISNATLNQLLKTLDSLQPQLIGLDLYRDFPIEPAQAELATRLQQDERLIGVCKARYQEGDSIAPPPDLDPAQVGFSDVVEDDGRRMVRRHLMYMTTALIDPGVACTSNYALSTLMALHYLNRLGITAEFPTANHMQLGHALFRRLAPHAGGYQHMDAGGFQVLLNYRANANAARVVSLEQVLSGQLNPTMVRDRIVLVGVDAPSAGDVWATPMNPTMPGVILQAHMISQILSAVLNDRPLMRVWPWGGDIAWLAGWAVLGSVLVQPWRKVRGRLGAIALALGLLSVGCWLLLIHGIWAPFVPSGLGLLLASGLALAVTRLRPFSIVPPHSTPKP